MDNELKEFLTSLKEKEIKDGKINDKLIEQFISLVTKNEENFIDCVWFVDLTAKRNSEFFKIMSRLHAKSMVINEKYKDYFEKAADTTSDFSKNFKEELTEKFQKKFNLI